MIPEFLMRAGLAGVGTAVAAGMLGSFVVWRRMAYFGDATAHAAILGVALALALQLPIFGGVLAVALVMALAIHALGLRGGLGVDTILGVMAHGSLAIGLVAVSALPGQRVSLETYLFGDILTVRWTDVAVIWAAALAVGAVLWRHWSRLLMATLSPDLAHAAGIDPRREQVVLTLLLALVVAVSIKIVGALLITAMLIIPAAAARALARTPEAMAAGAVGIGALATVAGLGLSWQADTLPGPSIVCIAVAVFLLTTTGARVVAR